MCIWENARLCMRTGHVQCMHPKRDASVSIPIKSETNDAKNGDCSLILQRTITIYLVSSLQIKLFYSFSEPAHKINDIKSTILITHTHEQSQMKNDAHQMMWECTKDNGRIMYILATTMTTTWWLLYYSHIHQWIFCILQSRQMHWPPSRSNTNVAVDKLQRHAGVCSAAIGGAQTHQISFRQYWYLLFCRVSECSVHWLLPRLVDHQCRNRDWNEACPSQKESQSSGRLMCTAIRI